MRHGLIFRAFRLQSLRCASCGMDLIYRSDFPFVCRWCHGWSFDVSRLIRATEALADAFKELARRRRRFLHAVIEAVVDPR